MHDALPILRFLADRASRAERVVLVTLTDVTGSAARAPGEQMAVAQDGTSVGSFSGGCVEAAVVAEALEVMAAGRARAVRFGIGSPYIDIRLPCGGGIDLLFTPDPDLREIASAIAGLESRTPITLDLEMAGRVIARPVRGPEATGWAGECFRVRHDPRLRLVIMGHGAEPGALLDQAIAFGADAILLSPQPDLVAATRAMGVPATLLRTLGRSEALVADPWTAVIGLFHDHDWETALLVQALEQPPFFIGAMGSRNTHAERLRRLEEAGCSAAELKRVTGPIGVIKATRDPRTLAVSIMAQVLDEYGRHAARLAASAQPARAAA